MVDFDFFTNQAKMLNLTSLLTGDCYYIGRIRPETEMLRYNFYDKSVSVWPSVYYSDIMKEIRTENEKIEANTNERLEELCAMIQMNLKNVKMKHRLSKMKEDF